MRKTITVIAHANSEDMFLAMLNAQTEVRIARDDAKCAREQRDAAFMKLQEVRLKVALENRKRIRRNKLIARIAVLGLCAAGCALSAVFCIRTVLWWTTIAPILTVAYSVFDLWHHDLR